ncbi:ATP-binding protein [Crenothrix polyspora]|uniref:Putative anti-sigma regulatory factor, serine/threonine protein kinase n=1 Tax=Crenothrix polyspora TaxID=360316 RepID=A0A1R4H876_9GAMM|nr:ATP-binding protein [Crenothrix polyspora]SJM92444.1 putative anti-sigma regulatory factor, serine/threonine protein kinase [Crenothrix polyspora]
MLTVDSNLENIQLISNYVKEIAKDCFNIAQLMEIEQAVIEAVNNCVKHAYGYSDQHPITIQCNLLDNNLLIEIIDEGKPFDVRCLDELNADFDFDPLDIANLPESGLGLKIIKIYMDKVSYHREDNKNRWLFKKKFLSH